MSQIQQRVNRIKEKIPILRVLADYGYSVHTGGEDREQQFSCDLHGDGSDNKPSARVYPDEHHFYCFACSCSRDVLKLVQEKEGVSFSKACYILEKKYGLPPLPWVREKQEEYNFHASSEITYSDYVTRIHRLIENAQKEEIMSLDLILRAWEAFDQITWRVEKGGWDEKKGVQSLLKIHKRLMKHQCHG